ncbi:MAG: phosphoribosyl-AMP cyclohydrolase [Salinisphaera sp.]|nr:phosphoribosyl-AMP cyclohydrolase [Salinisphaera sp.]
MESKPQNSQAAAWLDEIVFDSHGLVPVVTQDVATGRVLMLAWMNREAVMQTLAGGYAAYWSRSRNRLWRKGESSGHLQKVRQLRLDCDGDALLLEVEQTGGIACHTGRASCFYRKLEGDGWRIMDGVKKAPEDIYG